MRPCSHGASSSSFVYAPIELSAPEYQQWVAGVQATSDTMMASMASMGGGSGVNGNVNVRVHWWVLRKRCTARVVHDPDFVADVIARTGEVWDQVLAYRADRGLYEREVVAGGAASKRVGASGASGASGCVSPTSSSSTSKPRATATRRTPAAAVDVYAFISDDEGQQG